MANTYVDYTGNGSTTDFNFSFPYIKTSHVAVEVNDGQGAGGTNQWVRKTLTTDYSVQTSPNTFVRFVTAPASNVKVRVLRDSDANEGIVDFANGSVLTETELDNSYQHNRYLAEEAEEGNTGGALTKRGTEHYNADGLKLENVADPDSDDDAVNKGYADTRYVDAAGDTMSGDLNMGSNKITNLADPTVDADVANKNYVDDTITTSLATGSPPPGVQLATDQIEDDAITYAKLQNVSANNVLIGNDNGVGVDAQELTANEARTLLNVADGATANDSDANLKDRANHTGTQTAATISDFDTEVANNSAVAANTAKISYTDAAAVALNTAKVSNATHTGDATGDTALTLATVNSNVGSFTNADITVNAKGLVTAASSGTGGAAGTPNWSSGWVNTDGTTAVANGATLTFTHNLGTTNVNWSMYANASASDSGAASIHGHDVFTSGRFGALVKDLTSNTITFELAANGYSTANGSGATITESFAGDYVKVVVSASATVGAVSKYNSGWVTTDGTTSVANGATLSFTHSLGSDNLIFEVFARDTSGGTNSVRIDVQDGNSGAYYGAQVKDISTNTVTIQIAASGLTKFNSSGVAVVTNWNTQQIKVVVIG
jgi:hypothetical protein